MSYALAVGGVAVAYVAGSLGLFAVLIRLLSRQVHPEES
jgi:hypothetical protein